MGRPPKIENGKLSKYMQKKIQIEGLENSKQADNSLEITNLLIRLRHLNSSAVFVFHSLRTIPVRIFDFVHHLFIFKTNDNKKLILSKYKDILTEDDVNKIDKLEKYNYHLINFR